MAILFLESITSFKRRHDANCLPQFITVATCTIPCTCTYACASTTLVSSRLTLLVTADFSTATPPAGKAATHMSHPTAPDNERKGVAEGDGTPGRGWVASQDIHGRPCW